MKFFCYCLQFNNDLYYHLSLLLYILVSFVIDFRHGFSTFSRFVYCSFALHVEIDYLLNHVLF